MRRWIRNRFSCLFTENKFAFTARRSNFQITVAASDVAIDDAAVVKMNFGNISSSFRYGDKNIGKDIAIKRYR